MPQIELCAGKHTPSPALNLRDFDVQMTLCQGLTPSGLRVRQALNPSGALSAVQFVQDISFMASIRHRLALLANTAAEWVRITMPSPRVTTCFDLSKLRRDHG